MPAVKVRQVARDLSLSPGTVSKALRGAAGKVSVETAELVMEHCYQQGYLSRAEADRILFKIRSHASGKQLFSVTCFRGVLIYDAVFAAMCEQMQDNGLYPSSYLVNGDSAIKRFPYPQAGAVIILGRVAAEIVEDFLNENVPVVLVDSRIAGVPVSAVNSNNLEATSQAVQKLAQIGHEGIAFVCNHEDHRSVTYTFHQRQAGYMAGLATVGLPFREELLVTKQAGDYDNGEFDWAHCLADLRGLAESFLTLDPLPTAAVCANDMTAYMLRETLTAHGLRVPEDISIIGYDGRHRLAAANSIAYPAVSTMAVRWDLLGRQAVDLALELMCNADKTAKYLEVPTEYEDAGTVAPPRSNGV